MGADVATSSSLTSGWKKMPVRFIDQTKWPGYSDRFFHVATPAIYHINNQWYMYFVAAHSGGEYGWQHWGMWCIGCDGVVKEISMTPAASVR